MFKATLLVNIIMLDIAQMVIKGEWITFVETEGRGGDGLKVGGNRGMEKGGTGSRLIQYMEMT